MADFIFQVSQKEEDKNFFNLKAPEILTELTSKFDLYSKCEILNIENCQIVIKGNPETYRASSSKVVIGIPLDHKEIENNANLTIIKFDQEISLQNDYTGSRSVWIYKNDRKLICSTSYLAIIKLIGGFRLNYKAAKTFLTNGHLGHKWSLDERIEQLKPNSIIRINRKNFKFSIDSYTISFSSDYLIKEKVYSELQQTLDNVFNSFVFKKPPTISFSGGYDSRLLLLEMQKFNLQPELISWGKPDGLDIKGSDANVANKVAANNNLNITYFPISTEGTNAKEFFENFCQLSECRIDHVTGYLDNFKIWKNMASKNINCLIRGDEAFGWLPVVSEFEVRDSLGLLKLSEINYLKQFFKQESNADELSFLDDLFYYNNISDRRDHWYLYSRIPSVLASLNYIKEKFVTTANPLLDKRVVELTRKIRSDLRDDKRYIKGYLSRIKKNDWAVVDSNYTFNEVLLLNNFKEYALASLTEMQKRKIFPSALLEDLVYEIPKLIKIVATHESLLKRNITAIKKIMPGYVKQIIKKERKTIAGDKVRILIRLILINEFIKKIN